MAQLKPLLSLCIPIYNRLPYLEKQLARLLEDKDLFEQRIQLIVSDNCSEDDIEGCCTKYIRRGLKIVYHRNEVNLGSNGNFEWCFNNVEGKYVWLLGSDDIPVKGCIKRVLNVLENGDYGLLHLSMNPLEKPLVEYSDSNRMVVAISFWITFMSSNIVASQYVKLVNMQAYKETWLIQVPVYLSGCFASSKNAMLDLGQPFEKDNDALNNGGYHFFEVFVENLYGIYNEYVQKGLLKEVSFEEIKRNEFKDFLARNIVSSLLLKENNNYDNKNAWGILKKHYKNKPYTVYYVVISLLKNIVNRIIGSHRRRALRQTNNK